MVLGRYQLGARLAAGALGTVVAAVDQRTGRDVAVKFFDGARDNFSAWVDEMRLIMRLDHPHIVRCLDTGFDPEWDLSVLVFERALGGSLRRALADNRRFAGPEIAQLLSQLAAALAHAHSLGVVHRDIKPENILALTTMGQPPWALTDFGAGRFLARGKALQSLAGTLQYMAPEVLRGHATATSDLYSLGLVGLELLLGDCPDLERRSEFRLQQRHRADLAGLVARLLDPDPTLRLPTASNVSLALAATRQNVDVVGHPDGRRYVLCGDDVSVFAEGDAASRPVARVPRGRRFVASGAHGPVCVVGDRRIVCLEDRPSTLYASDSPFDAFVVSREHGSMWLVQANELHCIDGLGGHVVGWFEPPGRPSAWPLGWKEALADGHPCTGIVLEPSQALLAVPGTRTILHVRRVAQVVRVSAISVPAPVYALVDHPQGPLVHCGDATHAVLLTFAAGQLAQLERLAVPVDCVKPDAGPTGPQFAALTVPCEQPSPTAETDHA